MSGGDSVQKGKKRQPPGDEEFTANNEVKKVALMQQVHLCSYSFIFVIVNSCLYLFIVVDPGAFSRSNIFGGFDVKLYNPRDPSKVKIVISNFIYLVCTPARPTLINTACTLFMCLQ